MKVKGPIHPSKRIFVARGGGKAGAGVHLEAQSARDKYLDEVQAANTGGNRGPLLPPGNTGRGIAKSNPGQNDPLSKPGGMDRKKPHAVNGPLLPTRRKNTK